MARNKQRITHHSANCCSQDFWFKLTFFTPPTETATTSSGNPVPPVPNLALPRNTLDIRKEARESWKMRLQGINDTLNQEDKMYKVVKNYRTKFGPAEPKKTVSKKETQKNPTATGWKEPEAVDNYLSLRPGVKRKREAAEKGEMNNSVQELVISESEGSPADLTITRSGRTVKRTEKCKESDALQTAAKATRGIRGLPKRKSSTSPDTNNSTSIPQEPTEKVYESPRRTKRRKLNQTAATIKEETAPLSNNTAENSDQPSDTNANRQKGSESPKEAVNTPKMVKETVGLLESAVTDMENMLQSIRPPESKPRRRPWRFIHDGKKGPIASSNYQQK